MALASDQALAALKGMQHASAARVAVETGMSVDTARTVLNRLCTDSKAARQKDDRTCWVYTYLGEQMSLFEREREGGGIAE